MAQGMKFTRSGAPFWGDSACCDDAMMLGTSVAVSTCAGVGFISVAVMEIIQIQGVNYQARNMR